MHGYSDRIQPWEEYYLSIITTTTTGRDYSPYLKPVLLLWTGEGATRFGLVVGGG